MFGVGDVIVCPKGSHYEIELEYAHVDGSRAWRINKQFPHHEITKRKTDIISEGSSYLKFGISADYVIDNPQERFEVRYAYTGASYVIELEGGTSISGIEHFPIFAFTDKTVTGLAKALNGEPTWCRLPVVNSYMRELFPCCSSNMEVPLIEALMANALPEHVDAIYTSTEGVYLDFLCDQDAVIKMATGSLILMCEDTRTVLRINGWGS